MPHTQSPFQQTDKEQRKNDRYNRRRAIRVPGGGILELVWLVLIALRLFQLGQGERFMVAGTAHAKRVGPNR